ncbi:MAG: hypothetical protein K0R61_3230, partial [Microvirga sp.]|nr:hypothetical protein [Microvirga sp.]
CRVGLGALSLDERKSAHQQLIALVAQLLGAPPPYNQLTDPVKVAALLQQAVGEFRGLGAGRFFASPEEAQAAMQQAQQQPPPPDPKMEEVKGKLALQQQKMQGDLQMQGAKVSAQAQAQANKAWSDYQAKIAAVQSKERMDMAELGMEAQLERYAIDKKASSGQGKLPNGR